MLKHTTSIYVCMDGWYVCSLNARAGNFFYTQAPKYEKIPAKTLVFKTQKVDSTGYYGIEDPFPDLISKLRRFMGGYGVPVVGCQEPLVVRMP